VAENTGEPMIGLAKVILMVLGFKLFARVREAHFPTLDLPCLGAEAAVIGPVPYDFSSAKTRGRKQTRFAVGSERRCR
jgi:hypothetical protein